MRSTRSIALIVLAVSALVSCNRDPNVAKRRYLESGDKYFERARYKEARIQYRNAIKIDPRFGDAHYKLALTQLKIEPPNYVEAVKGLRRAIELIPTSRNERWDAVVKLAEIYLSPLAPHDEPLMKEVEGFYTELLKRDPKSFDGLRLHGDYLYIKAVDALRVKNAAEGQKLLADAAAQYRAADAVRPGHQGVVMQLARTATLANDLPGAEQYYRASINKDKSHLESYRELYTVLWYQKRAKDAEELLKAGYAANPKQYRFLIWLAEQYVLEQRRDDMLGVLQQLKSKSSEYDRAIFDVGDFYLRMGDGDSALREYKEGAAKDAKNRVDYQKRMIEVLMRQGKRTEAGEINAQILKQDPNDADAKGVAATLLLDKGDVTKALAELQQVVTRAPNNPVAHFNLGRAYYLHNDVEQARQQFAKAIELRPDYTAARLALAQLQVTRGDYEAALRAARDILKYDANNNNAKLVEAAALMGQKKFADSRGLIDGMLKVNPTSPDAYFQLGVVSLAENKYKDAEDAFRRAYQLSPTNPRGLMGVVETYMAQNMADQAIQMLEAEVAKAPNRLDLPLAIGNVAVRAGRWEKAISEFQKVLAKSDAGSKTRGEMNLRIGETLRRKGDLAGAVNSLQAARQTLPEDPRVLSTLGLTLESAGRWPEARQVYEAVLKIDANNGIVLNNLAFGLAKHDGNLDQALTLAQRAKQLIPNLPEVSDTLGWIYLKKNLPDNAIDIFRDLVNKQPGQTTFRYHYGMALYQKGDKAKALEELKKALAGNPPKEEQKEIQDLIKRMS